VSELRTINEAAARLRVSRATLYRLIAEKKIKLTKVRGSSFVTEAEIERYIALAKR
jgi:excisionase family DNA binding protein